MERKNKHIEEVKIRKAKVTDISKMNEIYVECIFDELKLQFPKTTNLSLIRKLNKYKKIGKKH
ncbi:hypothetical protein HOA59_01530 [archaeon]|nr:hypothetical protein [archaeon]MBT6824096.1 hypothetical protein [archaeon]MBT7107059.1 hypothetical protein [archaeon]MBT7297671.1 hypothetical protein [archaeon]